MVSKYGLIKAVRKLIDGKWKEDFFIFCLCSYVRGSGIITKINRMIALLCDIIDLVLILKLLIMAKMSFVCGGIWPILTV